MRTCLQCGDHISGRRDKKFCSDQCRNEYNNKLRGESDEQIKKVNKILRKNRNILSDTTSGGKNKIQKEKLLVMGFNFNYITGIYTTLKDKTYYYCYDFGYFFSDSDWIVIVPKEEYID